MYRGKTENGSYQKISVVGELVCKWTILKNIFDLGHQGHQDQNQGWVVN